MLGIQHQIDVMNGTQHSCHTDLLQREVERFVWPCCGEECLGVSTCYMHCVCACVMITFVQCLPMQWHSVEHTRHVVMLCIAGVGRLDNTLVVVSGLHVDLPGRLLWLASQSR